jgi:hypothetical protein
MRLRLTEFRPQTGPHEHRVVQPRHTLRPSRWPELRRTLKAGTPLSLRTDEARTHKDADAWTQRALQETGWLSQSSTPDSSLAFMSSGAAEARTDCRASSASSASEKP